MRNFKNLDHLYFAEIIVAGRLHVLEMNLGQLLARDDQPRIEVPLVRTGRQGRPSYQITEEQLRYMRGFRFKWTVIAKVFGWLICLSGRIKSSLVIADIEGLCRLGCTRYPLN